MTLHQRMLVAGVGLIGGSLGMAVRERHLVGEVVGFGRSEENLKVAVERGAIDRYDLDVARAAKGCDLVVLGVPVGRIGAVAAAVAPHARPEAIYLDVGSVKGPVAAALEAALPPPARIVPCHPIAGTENSGAAHAFAELFEGARCILTPTERTDADALEHVRGLWEAVGMNVETMTPSGHDRLFAHVSHLPHAVAFALVDALDRTEVEGRSALLYGGGGLRDTTRIAASDPVMWRDIFLENREALLEALDAFGASLERIRDRVERSDAALEDDIARVRAARRNVTP